MAESRTIAVAGKGGTGKTTIAGLLVRELIRRQEKPILAVDADPNANLGEILGVSVKVTVGGAREEAFAGVRDIPSGWDKQSWIEYKMHEALSEAEGYDLLSMGRPEGSGCYCYANNVFREYITTLAAEYPWVVMDNEAGLEHLSRHTTQDVDVMLLISDPTVRGVRTVERVSALVDELGLNVAERYLVINRVPEDVNTQSLMEHTSVPLGGTVPEDNLVFENDLAGNDVFAIEDSAESIKAVGDLVDNLIVADRV